jgi:hypothetical protein
MGFVGQHATHILELQSSLRPLAVPHCQSGIALRLRSILTLVVSLTAEPGVTYLVFAQQSSRLAPAARIIVDHNIFEIDPHTIGDTKVVTTIVGGKIVYEADAK